MKHNLIRYGSFSWRFLLSVFLPIAAFCLYLQAVLGGNIPFPFFGYLLTLIVATAAVRAFERSVPGGADYRITKIETALLFVIETIFLWCVLGFVNGMERSLLKYPSAAWDLPMAFKAAGILVLICVVIDTLAYLTAYTPFVMYRRVRWPKDSKPKRANKEKV